MTRLTLVGALCLACALVGQAAADSASTGKKLSSTPNSYDYRMRGFDWVSMDNACGGDSQSPIDVMTSTLKNPNVDSASRRVGAVNLHSLASSMQRFSNVKVNIEQGRKLSWDMPTQDMPTIEVNGVTEYFAPIQAHWHEFLSEHTINGVHYPLELHIVMASQNSSKLAVLGSVYQYGDVADPFVQRVLDGIEALVADGTASYGDNDVPIDLSVNVASDMLPSSMEYAGYDGSLTTPGCDEIVLWHLFTQPRTVTPGQLEVIGKITKAAHSDAMVDNSRVIQALNGRSVYSYTADNSGLPKIESPEEVARKYGFTCSGSQGKTIAADVTVNADREDFTDMDVEMMRRRLQKNMDDLLAAEGGLKCPVEVSFVGSSRRSLTTATIRVVGDLGFERSFEDVRAARVKLGSVIENGNFQSRLLEGAQGTFTLQSGTDITVSDVHLNGATAAMVSPMVALFLSLVAVFFSM